MDQFKKELLLGAKENEWPRLKPNSCMYPFSEKLVIIFLLNCAVRTLRARAPRAVQ